MNQSTKRTISTIAIVIASVAFGVVISADLGLMRASNAQTSQIQTSQGPVTTVTIPSFADVASRIAPAVVSITTTEIVHSAQMRRKGGMGVDPFEFFFPDPRDPRRRGNGGNGGNGGEDDERRQMAGGSGFFISPDGYIMTNNHVVDGASKVEVHYGADDNGSGGHTVAAKIIGRDPATDIALLKIDVTQPLPSVSLGDSDRIRKGDWAIAIGNPFQFENTLTVGVISAKGRALGLSETTRSFENFIQTDAAINFGNSGGPLLNINGEVIGINTAKRLLTQLKAGKVTRGYLGMSITEVTEKDKAAFGLPETRGAIVQDVTPGKPAEKAGVQHGDVIIDIDGKSVQNNRQLIDYISYLPVGTPVKLTVLRNGQRVTLTAKTAERPVEDERDTETDNSAAGPARNKLGMSVQELTPQARQMYGVGENVRGVVVTNVKEVSAAGEANISEGDVISEVQGEKITTVEQFRSAVDRAKSGQYLRMYVTTSPRGGGNPFSGYRIVQVP